MQPLRTLCVRPLRRWGGVGGSQAGHRAFGARKKDRPGRPLSGLCGEREMATITVQPELLLERILTLEIVRVTERAAVSSARLRGHGKDKASDQAAVDAMRRELNKLPIDGTVVIGEGEIDEAPMLFI